MSRAVAGAAFIIVALSLLRCDGFIVPMDGRPLLHHGDHHQALSLHQPPTLTNTDAVAASSVPRRRECWMMAAAAAATKVKFLFRESLHKEGCVLQVSSVR